jgi:glutamyl-tRNA synthetase
MAVVTRFAPSPTGKLHIGNLRAALLSWLTARVAGGQFILRIDDTDGERSKETFVDSAKRDLEWLGLNWDRFERQSDRFDRYEAAASTWREAGRLYACYETPTELELRRKRQRAMGKPPVYDRAALALSDAQKKAYEAEGRRPHWRFKLDLTRIVWQDQIRGKTSVDCTSVSDPVLIRGDGGWLYTPCSVVDDSEMGVTHVVRGEDHVTNTATQIQMINSLGFEHPTFAHHALMVGRQGEALSKRLGSLTLESLRDQGVEPLAIISFIARLGTSDPVEPRTTMQEAIDGFDITRFGRAPARFSLEELNQLNGKILQQMRYQDVADQLAMHGFDAKTAENFWPLIRGTIEKVAEVAPWATILRDGATPVVDEADDDFVTTALAMLPDGPWDEQTWKSWTSAVKDATGRKGRSLFMPLRKAMTGMERGPEMASLMPLLKRPIS